MLCVVHDVTEQKRLKNELEYAASRDPLTGLWNRRHFLDLLNKACQQKRRNDMDYSLLILDADHFKSINDQFGHDKGDEALVLLSKPLRAGFVILTRCVAGVGRSSSSSCRKRTSPMRLNSRNA
jgi:GGDEF domain-containing protein